MRLWIRTTCAVALMAVATLVGCSDSREAAITAPVKIAPASAHLDSGASNRYPIDPKPITDRVAALMGGRLARVTLPPDSFSRSSDAVHPDIACPPENWNGARCWMMYTPYMNSDPTYENPAFLTVANDTSWNTPVEIRNPIVAYPGAGSYNSDPDHAFDPETKRLIQVYRVVTATENQIMIMSTANARTWTKPRVAFHEKNHDAVSPSLVIAPDRSARVWYVSSGADGCQATGSTVHIRTAAPDSGQTIESATWSAARNVDMSIPNSTIWHLDVTPLPGDAGYVALIVAFTKGWSCAASDLWLGTSADGIHWRTYAIPILWRGMTLAKQRNISTWYRGTLRYDAATDSLHLWPSALAGTNWTIYHTAFKLHDLLGLLNAAQPADLLQVFKSQIGIQARIGMP
jgi:hypothetical protein